ILGSLDEIMNRDAYDANEKNLPEDFEATVIKGGNHSGFG
ncbi:MAG: alpha/beta hydrolase, partial [Alistipes sp.]|nr:alpha/beta hydrolase [Alistipes sp.]